MSQAANSTGVGDYVAAGLGQTSSTITSSLIATTTAATASSCPGANNTQITDRYGVKYSIYCDMYLPADNDTVPRTYTTRSSYSLCAPDCDQIDGCTGFTWLYLDEGSGTCSFRMNHGLPIASDEDEAIEVSISGRRVGNGTGQGTLGASSTTSSSRSPSTSTITACAAYQTAFANNTLGWYTTGPNLTFSGAVAGWTCLPENVPCNLICGDDEPGCISSGSSVAATCSPQWSAYSCSYSSYISEHITGSYTTTYGDIFTSTIMEYPTTVTANTSFTFQKWGGDTSIITPVYVFGTPTAVSTVTSTADDYAVYTLASSDGWYWSSTTDTESTYVTTYTTAYLDMYEYPLTDMFPVPTPACTIVEVYSETCDNGGGAGQYCNIYGGTVEVFYWPGVTPGPDGKFANTTKPVNPSTTEVSGITMTSPSVYVSFQSVYAADDCRQIGSGYTGSVLAFDPASISTVYGGPGFMSADIPDGASVYNFGDLGPTINAAAYERQVGCVIETGCPTIYPAYAPTISVPSELRSLDPSWASCYPDFRGFYDPPKALQQQQTVDGVSGYTSATPNPTISSVAANTGGVTTSAAQSTSEATASATGPSGDPDTSTERVSSPVAQTSETDLQQSGDTSPLSSPTTDAGSDPSHTTSGASSTDDGTSLQPASTPAISTADPGGVVGSLLGGQSSATQGEAQTSQADGDPDATETTNAGGIIGSLLGADSTQDPTQAAVPDSGQSTAAVGGDPAIKTAGPGGPESPAVATSNLDTPILTVGGTTVIPDSSGNYVIGSSTLAAGSSPVVVSGTTYSLAPSGSAVVVNGVTQSFGSDAATSALGVYVVGGQTYTQAAASGVVVAGSTLDAGSRTVISGTTYSVDPSGSALVVNGVTASAQGTGEATRAQNVFTANGQTYTEGASSEVVIAGQTLSAGSQTVIGGTTYSLASSGSALAVNGVTQTLQNAAQPTEGQAFFTVSGQTYTEGPSSEIVVAGRTLSPGSQTIIDGTTYSLAASGSALIVDGVTQTLQSAETGAAVLIVGSNTYTEDHSVSGFVVDSETLTEGGTIIVGSGTAAQTLRMTTASNGETEIIFGTTSTEIVGGASKTPSNVKLPSVTTAPSDSSTSGAASGSSTTTSGASSTGRLRSAVMMMIGLAGFCFVAM
ncbi:hypothetical protein LTR36_006397 [Oleoguttula mirabilis]|uniref:Apple domain-containing protein n=1 Tax=Oleoguttula mirabilis TaxID=1507867 RepID=A0AAV9JV79_9PEZI|nr:hypothetical protein LTR36_006397 [Oleoguttula mirabilis]